MKPRRLLAASVGVVDKVLTPGSKAKGGMGEKHAESTITPYLGLVTSLGGTPSEGSSHPIVEINAAT
jgi:hypothetical protein